MTNSNLLSEVKSSVLKELPEREKLEKANCLQQRFAPALVDKQEEILGKVETLTAINKELEAELIAVRERVEELKKLSEN